MLKNSKYGTPLRYTGIPAIISLIVGLIFAPIRDALIDAETAQNVLLQAIPFVAIFITILMLFILLIAVVAIRLHGRISQRAHQAIERTLVVGLIVGMVSMLQAIHIVGYRFGFILLLISLLSFILWTHVTPREDDKNFPAPTNRENMFGGIAGLIVAGIFVAYLFLSFQPSEPYGIRQRQWEFMSDEQKAEVEDEALSEFQTLQIPYFVFISLIPGALAFFVVRETVMPKQKNDQQIT